MYQGVSLTEQLYTEPQKSSSEVNPVHFIGKGHQNKEVYQMEIFLKIVAMLILAVIVMLLIKFIKACIMAFPRDFKIVTLILFTVLVVIKKFNINENYFYVAYVIWIAYMGINVYVAQKRFGNFRYLLLSTPFFSKKRVFGKLI